VVPQNDRLINHPLKKLRTRSSSVFPKIDLWNEKNEIEPDMTFTQISKMADRKHHWNRETGLLLLTMFLTVASLVFMIVALSGFGWWTYSTDASSNADPNCSVTGTRSTQIFPTGTKGTVDVENCYGLQYDTSVYSPFNAHNPHVQNTSDCTGNANAALALTIIAIILCAVALGLHLLYSTTHISVPLILLLSSIVAAIAVGIFINNNSCVAQYKTAKFGGIGS
jgi:hypothetical protein